jgi:hypothetical protein
METKERLLEELKETYPDVHQAIQEDGGECWTTDELQEEFEVLGFMAPFCVARRRETREKGALTFVHHPRLYYHWSVA